MCELNYYSDMTSPKANITAYIFRLGLCHKEIIISTKYTAKSTCSCSHFVDRLTKFAKQLGYIICAARRGRHVTYNLPYLAKMCLHIHEHASCVRQCVYTFEYVYVYANACAVFAQCVCTCMYVCMPVTN